MKAEGGRTHVACLCGGRGGLAARAMMSAYYTEGGAPARMRYFVFSIMFFVIKLGLRPTVFSGAVFTRIPVYQSHIEVST